MNEPLSSAPAQANGNPEFKEELVGVASGKSKKERTISKADREAFLSAAGAWRGIVDAERLKKEIYKSRGSDRPAVEL